MQETIVAASPGGDWFHLRLLQLLSARHRGLPAPPPDSLEGPGYVDDPPSPPAPFVDAPEADALESRMLDAPLGDACSICCEQMVTGEAVL
eukprot:13959015-Alexandrium_andersonii.AAC.1